jgi:hypothetical protein
LVDLENSVNTLAGFAAACSGILQKRLRGSLAVLGGMSLGDKHGHLCPGIIIPGQRRDEYSREQRSDMPHLANFADRQSLAIN